MAGFKKCGVYPFNPSAIQVCVNDNDDSEVTAVNDNDRVQQSSTGNDLNIVRKPSLDTSFTAEQELLFKRRFEEGYDIFVDTDYVRWLKLHHPEYCPTDGFDCGLSNDSIMNYFSDIITASPVATFGAEEPDSECLDTTEEVMVPTTYNASVASSSTRSMSPTNLILGICTSSTPLSSSGPSTSSTPLSISHPRTKSMSMSILHPHTSSTSLTLEPSTNSSPLPISGPSTNSTPSSIPGSFKNSAQLSSLGTPVRNTVSPILEELIIPTCSKKKGRATPRARLLTSDESLAELQEKEKKKKDQAEEKEKRKQEREEKKRLREETLRKKKEEKAAKAEERAKKLQEKKEKQTASKRKQNKRHVDATSEVAASSETLSPAEMIEPSEASSSAERAHGSNPKGKASVESIDPNTCCMCFGSFEDDVCNGDGAGWVSCNCGRWLHEDCVEDYVVNESGAELFCPFCTDGYVA